MAGLPKELERKQWAPASPLLSCQQRGTTQFGSHARPLTVFLLCPLATAKRRAHAVVTIFESFFCPCLLSSLPSTPSISIFKYPGPCGFLGASALAHESCMRARILVPRVPRVLTPLVYPFSVCRCAVESKARKAIPVNSTCLPSWTVTTLIGVSSLVGLPVGEDNCARNSKNSKFGQHGQNKGQALVTPCHTAS
ncbi:hypothetical protein VNO77_24903 [Canavalia gladiata]|uniref:Uncharacterized protein n=1 Tax=Canavalia gladiata TaxID=3824 RepID=A0AAN9L763_CANGL